MNLAKNRGPLEKWFETQGYGFIKFEGRDVFVHRRSYLTGFVPEVGQIVTFDFDFAPDKTKPPMAVNVRVWKSAKTVADEDEIKHGLEALKYGGAA
jgi:cold shock CspA family protein